MTEKPSIAMFGTGRLGALLGQEIVRRGLAAHLYLTNRSQRRMEGIAYSIEIFASIVGSATSVDCFGGKVPAGTEIAVIAVKDGYDPRDLLKDEKGPPGFERNVRTIGLRRDLPIVREVCNRLAGFRGVIVVLTNPVDLFVALVKEWVPSATVMGLGLSLDSARLMFCAKQLGYNCTISDALLGGVHIGKLVPLRSLWPESGPLRTLADPEITNLLRQAALIGPRLVRDLGFTLHDCATVFASDLQILCSPEDKRSFLLASRPDNYGATGWPLLHRGGEPFAFEAARISDEEKDAILAAGALVGRMLSLVKRGNYFGFERL